MPNKLAPSYVQHTFPLRFDSVARRFSERRPLRDSGSVALASSMPFLHAFPPCLSSHAFPPMPFLPCLSSKMRMADRFGKSLTWDSG